MSGEITQGKHHSGRKAWVVIGLLSVFAIIEGVAGFRYKGNILLADVAHIVADITAYVLNFAAERKTHHPSKVTSVKRSLWCIAAAHLLLWTQATNALRHLELPTARNVVALMALASLIVSVIIHRVLPEEHDHAGESDVNRRYNKLHAVLDIVLSIVVLVAAGLVLVGVVWADAVGITIVIVLAVAACAYMYPWGEVSDGG